VESEYEKRLWNGGFRSGVRKQKTPEGSMKQKETLRKTPEGSMTQKETLRKTPDGSIYISTKKGCISPDQTLQTMRDTSAETISKTVLQTVT
jgi:hypothetical protein